MGTLCDDNGLMWVYTNRHTWELIGKDDGLTWLTLIHLRGNAYMYSGFTLIHIRGNSIGTDQTRPDRTRQTDNI